MPGWLRLWLLSMILPVLAFAWYMMEDRARLRQRVAFLESGYQLLMDEKLGNRILTLEIQVPALALSMSTTRSAFLLFAEDRLDE